MSISINIFKRFFRPVPHKESFYFQEENDLVMPIKQLSHQHQIETTRPKNIDDIVEMWNAIPYWAENYYVYNRFLNKLENSCVSENGVVFNSRKVFIETILYEDHYALYDFNFIQKDIAHKTPKRLDDKNYLVAYNYWSSNYFHWMMDDMIKLFIIQQKCADLQLTLLMPESSPKFVMDALSFFHFPVHYFKANEYIVAKNLYHINNLSPSGLSHPLIKELPSLFLDKKLENKQRRIVISRAKSTVRHITNENELMQWLQPFGFELIYCEDYSFHEQMELFSEVEILVAPHGAGLTNSLFMPKGATVIEIASTNILNQPTCYWNLANMMGLNYYYIPTPQNSLNNYVISPDGMEYLKNTLHSVLNASN